MLRPATYRGAKLDRGHSNRLSLVVLLGISALTLASIPAAAQITTGSITGTVVDDAKDPLPGAVVSARNVDMGLERAVPADRLGKFSLIGLPPGDYEVSATLSGYGALPQDVVVRLGQTSVLDFSMQPLRFTENVTVTAQAPLLNTTKSELSIVVTRKEIAAYPLLNREFTDLAVLAPGVKQAPSGQFEVTKKPGIYTPFTTGGTAGRNLNISIDGADNNDPTVGFYELGFPADGIKEFEVIQDMPTAEYGRSSGAVINVLTRSGTNDFGGSVFGLWRSGNTRAANLSERLAGVDKAPSDRYQYGFALGGADRQGQTLLFHLRRAPRRDDANRPEPRPYAIRGDGAAGISVPLPGTRIGLRPENQEGPVGG